MILNKRPTSEIKRAAKEDGMTFLRDSAVDKMRRGHHDAERDQQGHVHRRVRIEPMTRYCESSLARHISNRFLQEPPPAMAFEISEAGIAAARIGARAELDFHPLKPGTLSVSPLQGERHRSG